MSGINYEEFEAYRQRSYENLQKRREEFDAYRKQANENIKKRRESFQHYQNQHYAPVYAFNQTNSSLSSCLIAAPTRSPPGRAVSEAD